jgi:hypothetical protein
MCDLTSHILLDIPRPAPRRPHDLHRGRTRRGPHCPHIRHQATLRATPSAQVKLSRTANRQVDAPRYRLQPNRGPTRGASSCASRCHERLWSVKPGIVEHCGIGHPSSEHVRVLGRLTRHGMTSQKLYCAEAASTRKRPQRGMSSEQPGKRLTLAAGVAGGVRVAAVVQVVVVAVANRSDRHHSVPGIVQNPAVIVRP